MIWLIFAHFIGDFALQSSWMAQNKRRLWYVMLAHCIIWAGVVSIALVYTGRYADWKVGLLVGGHFAIDSWKAIRHDSAETWWQIYPDQALHLAQCAVVFYL